jgi:hypothetical protein
MMAKRCRKCGVRLGIIGWLAGRAEWSCSDEERHEFDYPPKGAYLHRRISDTWASETAAVAVDVTARVPLEMTRSAFVGWAAESLDHALSSEEFAAGRVSALKAADHGEEICEFAHGRGVCPLRLVVPTEGDGGFDHIGECASIVPEEVAWRWVQAGGPPFLEWQRSLTPEFSPREPAWCRHCGHPIEFVDLEGGRWDASSALVANGCRHEPGGQRPARRVEDALGPELSDNEGAILSAFRGPTTVAQIRERRPILAKNGRSAHQIGADLRAMRDAGLVTFDRPAQTRKAGTWELTPLGQLAVGPLPD